MEVNENILTITVDLNGREIPSSSGKSLVIASTEGNATVATENGAVQVGINVYRKNK